MLGTRGTYQDGPSFGVLCRQGTVRTYGDSDKRSAYSQVNLASVSSSEKWGESLN